MVFVFYRHEMYFVYISLLYILQYFITILEIFVRKIDIFSAFD